VKILILTVFFICLPIMAQNENGKASLWLCTKKGNEEGYLTGKLIYTSGYEQKDTIICYSVTDVAYGRFDENNTGLFVESNILRTELPSAVFLEDDYKESVNLLWNWRDQGSGGISSSEEYFPFSTEDGFLGIKVLYTEFYDSSSANMEFKDGKFQGGEKPGGWEEW